MSVETLNPETSFEIEADEDVRPSKGWVVVVYNDNHHTFQYVIECLCQILHMTSEQALNRAVEIHNEGESVVAGPMSKYEAQEIANKIAKYGPDPYSLDPKKNVGLKTSVKEA